MLDKQDVSSPTQDELIKNLLFYDWVEEFAPIRKTFLVLLNAYLGSDKCENADPEARQEIAFHILVLDDTIEKLKQLQSLIAKKTA